MSIPTRLLAALALALAAAAYLAAPAFASEPIEFFSTSMSTTQAGGHPDLTTRFSLEEPGTPEAARNIVFNAPGGIFGNPRAATECAAVQFALAECAPNSQVGLITLRANYAGKTKNLLGTAPLFALVPGDSETARFAFIPPTLDLPISISVAVRTASDYGLRFTVRDLTQLAPLAGVEMTIWGFPAESTHDAQRFPKGEAASPPGCPGKANTSCLTGSTPASIAPQPLIDNPTVCSGEELKSTLDVQTYQDPENLSGAEASYPPITGCEKEDFNPVIQASPTTKETDSASGLNLDLSSPQFLSHAAAPSQIKTVRVDLPEGFTINPDAADGLTQCSSTQADFGSEAPAACPDSAKLGTFSISTPALPERLQGALYLGEPSAGDPYRLFMIASGFGMNVKLVGSIKPDPASGRLRAEFNDLPQAPFEDLELHLFSGDRALMATPNSCGDYTVSAEFFPWNATLAEQSSEQHFGLSSGPHGAPCPGLVRGFSPSLLAGTTNASAGAFSSYLLAVGREDGEQTLARLGFTMPPGLSADLRGVAYCPDQAILSAAGRSGSAERASSSCPAASEIGTSNVAAGPGASPFHAVGRIYLAGPFEGAALSLVAITPALAGPYDYGTIVVRVALGVDPLDAHVSASSEAIPKIIGGVPLRLRSIEVNVDRPNFIINPTNCSGLQTGSAAEGDQGTQANFGYSFVAVNCTTLPFSPTMKIRLLGGRRATKRGVDPAMQFDLRTRPGDANLKTATVTLPSAFEVDATHLANLCTEKELHESNCAGRQAIGTVTDTTPQLDQPLRGKVYAVSGAGGLPHLAFLLDGQVDLVPRAETETVSGQRLKTMVPVIPDAQVGHFHLLIYGGKRGYLTNTRNLCGRPPRIEVSLGAQNGRSQAQRAPLKTDCAAGARRTERPRAAR